jgi:glycosyltransferase involved in cell wall biosynthesis
LTAAKAGFPVFASMCETPGASNAIERLREVGVTLHLKQPRRNDLASRIRQRANWNGVAGLMAMKAFRPDVIVISGGNFDWLSDGALMAAIVGSGAPYITVAHNATGFVEADDRRAEARRFLAGAAKACFASEALLRMTERHLAAALPNGVSVLSPLNLGDTRAYPLSYPTLDGPLLMSMVSRLNCYTKGHDYLIESLADESLRRRDFLLNIFGSGPHGAYLANLVAHHGLGDKVRFRGHSDDVAKVWEGSHVNVLPSVTEGGPPIALLEAMYCGRPSVAARVGGVDEWIDEGRHGFLAETAHPRYLVPALQRVFQHRGRLANMGVQAHEDAARRIGRPVEDFLAMVDAAA